jgi:hypothetical protein
MTKMTRNFFCKHPRFGNNAIDQYGRSLCAMSPGVFNALSSTDGSRVLVIDDFAAVASIPKLVIAGDHDQLVTQQMSSAIAESLGAQYVTVGKEGFEWLRSHDWDRERLGRGSETMPRLVRRPGSAACLTTDSSDERMALVSARSLDHGMRQVGRAFLRHAISWFSSLDGPNPGVRGFFEATLPTKASWDEINAPPLSS